MLRYYLSMALIVIGGHARNVGKTSVVAGLIAALPQYQWNAFKISQHGHGICSTNGQECHCANADHSWAISEETDRLGESDTSRFLVAGAVRAWWVRTEPGRLAEAMPTLRRKLAEARNAIVESNSIMRFMLPDLYFTVIDPATADVKKSAQEFLDLADAIILHASKEEKNDAAVWAGVSLELAQARLVFTIQPPPYVTPEIVNFVEGKLRTLNLSAI